MEPPHKQTCATHLLWPVTEKQGQQVKKLLKMHELEVKMKF